MGTFDTIEVHRKLPLVVVDGIDSSDVKDLKRLIKWKEVEFQTTSLDNCLDHYRLSFAPKVPTSLVFYSSVTLEPFSYWVEFEVIFLQGQLEAIKLLAFEKNASDFDGMKNIPQEAEKQSLYTKLFDKLRFW